VHRDFSNCVGDIPGQGKDIEAIKMVAIVGTILLIAARAGVVILKAFGVSLDAVCKANGAPE